MCGSADGQTFSSTPTVNLCSVGTTGSVTDTNSGFSWTCFGQYGGNDDPCFAYLQSNITVSDASVSEGNNASVSISLTSVATGNISVDYDLIPGTALSDVDYVDT